MRKLQMRTFTFVVCNYLYAIVYICVCVLPEPKYCLINKPAPPTPP